MSQDLWAVYRLLMQFEKSKSLSDSFFDRLVGPYAVVDVQGRIYRANFEVAQLFHEDVENVLGFNFLDLIPVESQPFFLQKLQKVDQSSDFESPLRGVRDEKNRAFHWLITTLPGLSNQSFGPMRLVVGRDISDLKLTMRSLLEVEKDLDFAREVQSLFLPSESHRRFSSWSYAAHYEPAAKTGGDWWRVDSKPNGSGLVLLGDVTGHGAGAGMVTAMVSGGYSVATNRNTDVSVPELLGSLNDMLRSMRGGAHWMTMFAAEVLPQTNSLHWYCVAAPSATLFTANGETQSLGDFGRPLGAGDLSFSSGITSFHVGDRLFLATDGLWEVHSDLKTRHLDRALRAVLKTDHGRPDVARDKAISAWRQWSSGYTANDDVAFVIIDRI